MEFLENRYRSWN